MHELLTSRGFVRRADALDLAEVKDKEAAADAAAAVARKERAEAAAQRRIERGEDKKLSREQEDTMVRTTLVSLLYSEVCVFVCCFCWLGSRQGTTGGLSREDAKPQAAVPACTVFTAVL